MASVNFKREFDFSLDEGIKKITEALKAEGFGVLTRIDFHLKVKEKLGKDIAPAVILGACNPQLAFEAYQRNTDIASLIPCNAVVREIGKKRVSIELAKPTALMEMLGDKNLVHLAGDADRRLQRILETLN